MQREWIDDNQLQVGDPSAVWSAPSGPFRQVNRWLRSNGKHLVNVALLLLWVTGSHALALAADDPVAQARSLAYSGKEYQEDALRILEQYLVKDPADDDARVFYGTVLSWRAKYVEARDQLSRVLAEHPDHSDALQALINVELWSHDPGRAEELARQGLSADPNNIDLWLARATALRDLGRRREALATIDRVLQLSPANADAKRLRRTISDPIREWEAKLSYSSDWFSDHRSVLQQTSLSLRAPSPIGPLLATVNRADQYGLTSYQTEIEAYPHLGPRTYGHLEFGYSPDANLYPGYRGSAELFHGVGHGIELSGGYWHLQFDTGVNVYTFAVGKYCGNWLFTGRGFLTPGAGMTGTALLSARRFFGGEGRHDFLEFAYSRGSSPALATTISEAQALSSSRFIVTYDKVLGKKWVISGTGFIGQEQQAGVPDLKRYSLQGSVLYRF